jgi:HAD superfamily hydrolase (TIGR01490 family)
MNFPSFRRSCAEPPSGSAAGFYPGRVPETISSPPDAAQPTGVAAFFDLDKTIIASSSALAFSKPLLRQGLISRRAALKSAYAQLVFSLSGADENRTERMRAEISALCTGWDVAQVRAIVNETLHDIVDPLVYAEAAELIASHQEQGHDVIVLSAAGEEVVTPIAAMLGATRSVATRMEIVDGRYSGQVDFYCYGEQKAVAAKQLAADHGYDLSRSFAYTDSSTDVPMLEVVGKPHAVNPDRALRRLATERGWAVLTFSNPVSLRSRIPAPSPTTLALTVGIGAMAAAGVTWYGLARRRRDL